MREAAVAARESAAAAQLRGALEVQFQTAQVWAWVGAWSPVFPRAHPMCITRVPSFVPFFVGIFGIFVFAAYFSLCIFSLLIYYYSSFLIVLLQLYIFAPFLCIFFIFFVQFVYFPHPPPTFSQQSDDPLSVVGKHMFFEIDIYKSPQ